MGVEIDPISFIVQQTRANVDFLVAQHQISAPDARLILSKLPESSDETALARDVASLKLESGQLATPPASNPPSSYSNNPPPQPSLFKVKALWGYNEHGQNPNDLPFRTGDIIEVTVESNPEWWTGRVNGKEGLFPSNYVERIEEKAAPLPLPTPAPTRGYTSPSPSVYTPPSYGGGGPGYYPPPSGPPSGGHGYYQPPPGGPPPPQQYPTYNNYGPPPPSEPVPHAEPPKEPGKFGKLGDTMATSAAGGFGFGAGSAAGSNLINSIF